MKNKSGKKEKGVVKDAKQKMSSSPGSPEAQDEGQQPGKGFDFGGLPDRDLKKNMGCGS